MLWIIRIGLILGAIGLTAYGLIDFEKETLKQNRKWWLGVPLLLLFVLTFCFKQVEEGKAAVPVNLGVAGDAKGAGVTIDWPWVKYVDMSVREEVLNFEGNSEEKKALGLDDISLQTKGGGGFDLDARVRIQLPQNAATDVWKQLGSDYVTQAAIPASRECLRDAAVELNLTEAITTARPTIAKKASDCLRGKLTDTYGINVISVELGGTEIPADVKKSIDAKQAAEQNRQAALTKLEQAKIDAKKKAVQARGTSDSERIIACGYTTDAEGEIAPNVTCEKQFSEEFLQWELYQKLPDVEKVIIVDPRLDDAQLLLQE